MNMARQKRAESVTGIYHIMLRGINKQKIFLDYEDYNKFLSALKMSKDDYGFKLHAFCLMDNHVHLLIQHEGPFESVFKSIGARFVYWYNIKYKRVGGLFQGRFKSIPVNDDEYYLSVIRYIHQNPVKAGISNNCSEYEFSSYNAYVNNVFSSIVDKDFTLSLMSLDEFKRIHDELVLENHLELSEETKKSITDEEAMRIIEKYTHCKSKSEFQEMPIDMQKAYISLLKNQNLSIRQIVRLTGLSKYYIEHE